MRFVIIFNKVLCTLSHSAY